jgi:hypothetical protein
VPGLPPPAVAPASVPAPAATAREAGAARRRIALFLLVLVVAASAAWGAGRLLSQTLEPAAPMDPHMNMDHSSMPGMQM